MIFKSTQFEEKQQLEMLKNKSIACIGFFDGLHKVHKSIINKTIEFAKEKQLNSIVITFSQKVIDFLNNQNNSIQSKQIKYSLIEQLFNPDLLIEIQVNNQTIKLTPQDFCLYLKNILNVEYIVVGSDFKFGYMGKGNIDTLCNFFGEKKVIIFPRTESVSTSLIKQYLKIGDIDSVNNLLDSNIILLLAQNSDNQYSLVDFNYKIADGYYKIKYSNELYNVKIKNNLVSFEKIFEKEQIIIEIIEKK